MAMINIPSSVDDHSYRYKMPRLIAKVEGRGNGIKTCIVNMDDVARALNAPPIYITKFFGHELGAGTSYSDKVDEGKRCIVKGERDQRTLQSVLDRFIESFVLCQSKKCRLPEIDVKVKKGFVLGSCRACGWCGKLDNDHKLAKEILKDKKKDKEPKPKPPKEPKEPHDPNAKLERKETDEKEKKKEKEREKNKGRGKDKDNETPAKKDKNQNEGSDSAHSGSDREQGELSYDSLETCQVIRTMREFVTGSSDAPEVSDFFEELRMHQLSKCFDHKVRLYVALEALFPKGMDASAVLTKVAYLKKCIGKKRMGAQDLLWAFEVYLKVNPGGEKGFGMVLKSLYDSEIIEEEELLEHYKKEFMTPGFMVAKAAAARFLEWLQTAEETSSDSEED